MRLRIRKYGVCLLMAAAAVLMPRFTARADVQGSASWKNEDRGNSADLYVKLVDSEGDHITAVQIEALLTAADMDGIDSVKFEFDSRWEDEANVVSSSYNEKLGRLTLIVANDGKKGLAAVSAEEDELLLGTLTVESSENVRALINSAKTVSDGELEDVVSIHGIEVSLTASKEGEKKDPEDPEKTGTGSGSENEPGGSTEPAGTPGSGSGNDSGSGSGSGFGSGSDSGSGNGSGSDSGSGSGNSSGNSSGSGSGSSSGGSSGSRSSGGGSSAAGLAKLPTYVVSNGTWRVDEHGRWFYTAGRTYANEWAAIYNPYADVSKGQSAFDWFYFGADGAMVTGWFTDAKGDTYYLSPEADGTMGHMVTGWNWIDGDGDGYRECYYFEVYSNGFRGRLYRSTVTRDGYTVNELGQWTQDGKVMRRNMK